MPGENSLTKEKGKITDQPDDYERLRSLLLGEDYEQVIQKRLAQADIDRVAEVISEAFTKRNQQDDSLAKEISPVIEDSINASIKNHPERITNVIFPIIGPAVRKAVSNALSDLIYSLNHLLQHSLSVRSLVWRLKAWRLGIPYGQYVLLQTIQYQVEQVFLIHRESGLLIQSSSTKGISYQDPDLVSSMMTAITDFATDSFNQKSDSLNVLQFGDLTLLIETGPHAVLAFAVRGVLHKDVKQHISELLEKIHAEYAQELGSFDGDTSRFEPCSEWLEQALLRKEKVQEKTPPWMAIFAILILVSIISFFSYRNWQLSGLINQVVEQVNGQAGYQVIEQEYKNEELHLLVLQSPLAVSADDLVTSLNVQKFEVIINKKLAALDSPELFTAYLERKYGGHLTAHRKGESVDLLVNGEISAENLSALKQDALVENNFNLVLSENLKFTQEVSVQEKSRREFNALVDSINRQFFYFEVASTKLKEASRGKLHETIVQLKQLVRMQDVTGFTIQQIGVSGYADSNGGRVANLSISSDRAKLVKSILEENGITEELVVSWGYGAKDLDSVDVELQRRAKIEVLYIDNQSIIYDQ